LFSASVADKAAADYSKIMEQTLRDSGIGRHWYIKASSSNVQIKGIKVHVSAMNDFKITETFLN